MTDRPATGPHSDGLRRGEPREAGVNAALVEAFLDDTAASGLDIHGLRDATHTQLFRREVYHRVIKNNYDRGSPRSLP